MTLESLLAEVRAAEAKATKGPIQASVFEQFNDTDAEFFAKSRTYVPTMARVIEVLLKYGDFPSVHNLSGLSSMWARSYRDALAAALAGDK